MHMDQQLVIALGGNAILPKDADATAEEEFLAVHETVEYLAPVLDEYDIVLTHGNGPQVGQLLLEQPEMSLDVLVAETQGQIGYMLQQELQNNGYDAATIITQTLVDADDPAFNTYTKPVGPFYTEAEAEDHDFETVEVSPGEYRRVVPSPAPQQIVEQDIIDQVQDDGSIPVCVGGGGVPIVQKDDGLAGVEAVVDKDRASQVLATALDADQLVILTNVPCAYAHYGEEEQEPLEAVIADELEELLEQDVFGVGSMRPKVEACINFIRNGGKQAIITAPEQVEAALNGEAGTRVRGAR